MRRDFLAERPAAPGNLDGYGQSRGLVWRREARSMPFGCLFDHLDGHNFNLLSGVLPGGMHGVIAHRVLGGSHNVGGGGGAYFYESATMAAVMVPETKTTLVAASYSDADAGVADAGVDIYHGIPMQSAHELEGWRVWLNERTDAALADALWSGPLGGWLRGECRGWRLVVRAGIVSVWHPSFVTDPAALDRFATTAASVAGHVRELCLPATAPQPFSVQLPAPAGWVSKSKRRKHQRLDEMLLDVGGRFSSSTDSKRLRMLDPGAKEEDDDGAVLRDFARAYAQGRGLELEDPRSFDCAHPGLPFGGWSQIVWRGPRHRLVVTAQRPYIHAPQHAGGAVAAVVETGEPDSPLRFDTAANHFTAVVGGLRTVFPLSWRHAGRRGPARRRHLPHLMRETGRARARSWRALANHGS